MTYMFFCGHSVPRFEFDSVFRPDVPQQVMEAILSGQSSSKLLKNDLRPCAVKQHKTDTALCEEIFEDCRDLVQSAVDGHNATATG